jgi:hypothetical protein
MLVVSNSAKKPCGCHGGLGFLGFPQRTSRGLGDAASQKAQLIAIAQTRPLTTSELQQLAQLNGVDPAAFNQAVASGADSVQLTLLATGGIGAGTLQSELDTVNEIGAIDLGTPTPTATPAPGASWLSEDSLGLGLSNGTYLLIGGIGIVGLGLAKKFI